MKIEEWVAGQEAGAVLVDSDGHIVRAWTARPAHPATLRALRRFFPAVEERGEVLRLGGFRGFLEVAHAVAEAKMTSASPFVQALHLVEGSDGVGMQTIPARLFQNENAPAGRGTPYA